MAGKKIRPRNSQNSVPVANLANRPLATPPKSAGGGSNSSKLSSEQLLALTKEQLKVECRKRGQKTTGNRKELLQRLGFKMVAGIKRRDAKETPTANGSSTVLTSVVRSPSEAAAEAAQKQKEKDERASLVLWKRPIVTTEYFIKEVSTLLYIYGAKALVYKKTLVTLVLSVLGFYILMHTSGPHQYIVQRIFKQLLWCLYWIGLGILSSVGLGTGLHTFLLYLGPHIAQVTLAAYECESLNFPEPPYPDDIVCPSERDPLSVTIWAIMSKVRLEAVCWGAGTALGELPPYFMARAARLSGTDPDDEDDDLREFEELQKKQKSPEDLSFIDKGKLFVEELVAKVGFLGILACASIPNPLFDLAGITCGHFLVPFWTFFGATLLGKAVIKMHIQKLFVIIAFNETLITTALDWLRYVPVIGNRLQVPFKAFLESQKLKLHKETGPKHVEQKGNILASIFEKFVIAMILYFVVSIVNSFAQSYHKRLRKRRGSHRGVKD